VTNRENLAQRAVIGRLLRILQFAFLLSGLTLLGFYATARLHSTLGRAQALEAFAAAQAGLAVAPSPLTRGEGTTLDAVEALPALPVPDQSLWGKSRIKAYGESLRAALDPATGVLTIPAIDLAVPIFEGTTELVLNRGAGRIEGTAALGTAGNVGIAGHRDGFFRGLKDVELGDTIDVQFLGGTTRYRVTELLIVEPTDVYVLDPTNEAVLTLVTCYPFYFVGEAPQRYIVKAVETAG
jgi:sortase A